MDFDECWEVLPANDMDDIATVICGPNYIVGNFRSLRNEGGFSIERKVLIDKSFFWFPEIDGYLSTIKANRSVTNFELS